MMDEATQKRKLLESLYLKTAKGDIEWSYDNADDSCEAAVGEGYIQIVYETDEEGDYFPVVKILNWQKDTIDRITGGLDLSRQAPVNTGHDSYWQLINDLRTRAERSAKGADVVIKSILDFLDADSLSLDRQKNEDDIPF